MGPKYLNSPALKGRLEGPNRLRPQPGMGPILQKFTGVSTEVSERRTTATKAKSKSLLLCGFQPAWDPLSEFAGGAEVVFGSAQESDGECILGRFLKGYEFGSGGGHALSL